MSTDVRTDSPAGPGDLDRGLCVYGVVPVEATLPAGLTGVDGEPLGLVPGDTTAAVVSSMTLARPPGRKAELLAFQAAVDAVAAAVAIAPVRFGTVLASEDAVREFLWASEGELDGLLAMLDGRRQYNLRATYVEDVVLAELVTAHPEIRDLRERTRDAPEAAAYPERMRLGELIVRGLEQRSADDAAALVEVVFPHAVAHVDRSGSDPSVVLDVALLVDDAHGDELVQTLEELAEAVHERIRLQLVGPMAPYDFAGAP